MGGLASRRVPAGASRDLADEDAVAAETASTRLNGERVADQEPVDPLPVLQVLRVQPPAVHDVRIGDDPAR